MENSNDEDAFHISQRGLVTIMLMEYQNVKAKSLKSINSLLMDFHKAFPCANSYLACKVGVTNGKIRALPRRRDPSLKIRARDALDPKIRDTAL